MLAVSTLLWAAFWDTQLARWVVWVGLVVLTVTLLLLLRTRWGGSQPLGKCVVLSLLAHLLLALYMTTVNIVTSTVVGSPDGQGIQIALIDGPGGDDASAASGDPWPGEADSEDPPRETTTELPAEPPAEPTAEPAAEPTSAAPPEAALPLAPVDVPLPDEMPEPTPSEPVAPVEPPIIDEPLTVPVEAVEAAEKPQPPLDVPPPDVGEVDAEKPAATPAARPENSAELNPTATPGPAAGATGSGVAPALRQRLENHLQVARGFGATQESEAAVNAALRYLAGIQDESGRWDPRRLGAGAGRAADNEDRQSAGAQADSGITGLVLLAFLAAGHTHQQGPHQSTVRHGLEYLLRVQDADGCLSGTSNRYERMYCHAMATCALSEALAMTADRRIEPGVQRAIHYTLAAQDRVTGGWRYMPGDPGDTSQLGWQVMALKSAELGGIAIPRETRDGIARFLRSVSAGEHRGLARYQPSRGTTSRSMTAEAMVCRQFIGIGDSPATTTEALQYLLQETPGKRTTNMYYWYYATLGLYQLQGDAWQRWNQALQHNLLSTQHADGPLAGSWDPDPVWGACGGRAYSTALSALCLEVYYRFLPLYAQAGGSTRLK